MSTDKDSNESANDFKVRIEKAQVLRKWDIVIYILIMVVVLLTLGQALISYRADAEDREELKSYVKCQAAWNQFTYKASVAGREANANTQTTMDVLIDAIYQAKSAEETRRAIEAYKQAREAQRQALISNPYPPPPEQVCELG